MSTPQEKIEAALNGPAMKPPPGTTDFDPTLPGRSDEQVSFFVTVSICTVVAGIFMILRYYSRIVRRQGLKLADYLLILGFLGNIALVVNGRVTVTYGAGVHQYNMKLGTLFQLLYYINIHQMIYGPTIFCIKAAIILQYISIFAPTRTFNKYMFYGGYITLVANLLFYLIRTIVSAVYCIPREAIWNKLLPGAKCVRQDWFIVSSGFINAISDIIILVLPIASVWALQLPLKKKIQICLLFTTGLLACLASCIRIYYGWKTTTGTQGQIDSSYYMAYEGLWAYAELALGIVVACSLSIPKLLKESSIISSTFSRVRGMLSQALGRSNSQIQLVDSDVYQLQEGSGTASNNVYTTTVGKNGDAESQRHLNQDIHVQVAIDQSSEDVNKAKKGGK